MKKQRRLKRWGTSFLLLIVIGGYTGWALLRPLPSVTPIYNRTISVAASQPVLTWPKQGQAAASAIGTDSVTAYGEQKPAPMASTAKVITALMVLQKKPLALGQSGPSLTITDADVAIYNKYVAQDGSVLPVQAGEQLTEYQMLQALMLPSANNIADTMVIWAFGSLQAYAEAANSYLQSQGFKDTRVGSDASGLAPDTVSTAHDLVKIGKLAMAQPVLAQIVGQPTATGLPLTTVVRNVNFLLGSNNIVGIKTGNSDQAGGAFVGAAKTTISGKPVTVVTAVMAAPDLFSALAYSKDLLVSAQKNFETETLVPAGSKVGVYRAPWGATAQAISPQAVSDTVWRGETDRASVQLSAIKPDTPSKNVGEIILKNQSNETASTHIITLDKPLAPPSLIWRLTHPQ